MSASTPVTELKTPSSVIRTLVLKPVRGRLGKKDLLECVDVLNRGGIVIFPTETVYGIACNAFNQDGISKIYSLKGRSYTKPLPVFLMDASQLELVAKDVPKEAAVLMENFWPGPLTLVFKTAFMALHAVRGKSTIAVRIPDHGLVQQILKAAHVPLAVTSANLSDEPSLKSGAESVKQFSGKVDVVVDGGKCRIGRESTVIDASHFPFTVLRQGALEKEKLARTLNL